MTDTVEVKCERPFAHLENGERTFYDRGDVTELPVELVQQYDEMAGTTFHIIDQADREKYTADDFDAESFLNGRLLRQVRGPIARGELDEHLDELEEYEYNRAGRLPVLDVISNRKQELAD